MDPITWTYRFILSGNREQSLEVKVDPEEMRVVDVNRTDLPEWTRLEVNQCSNCPLDPESSPTCPLAAALVEPIQIFSDVVSYDTLTVEIESPERTIRQDVAAQNAVGSLMGLIMATSGCPRTAHFRPMARFHLPLASQSETLYRAASMYMLAQYFRNQAGEEPDLAFEGLSAIYQELEVLNAAMARRVRNAINQDAAVNAVVVLDFFAKNWAFSIDEHLEEIKSLFQSYIGSDGKENE